MASSDRPKFFIEESDDDDNDDVEGGVERSRSGSVTHIDPSYKRKILKQFSVEIHEFTAFESKVLVLYTGGTIGMKCHNGVYSPESNYLEKELRKLPIFHNSEYDFIKSPTSFDESTGLHPPLVMPISKEGKHIIYTVYEYEPLLDSCNMTMNDWARIAKDIKQNYFKFDGFVILHGTDTMAYTASALSFMLENLGKPVILTGSQIPIFETRCDGRDNFLGALIIAGHYCIPEVTIYFHNKLMRGNRCMKTDNSGLDAFNSPNMSSLVTMEIGIHVDWHSVMRSGSIKRFDISTNLCPNVGLLRLFPSITVATVNAFLQPPIEGIVIESYGAGNVPHARKDLMAALEDAAKRGIIIVNITQCSKGFVSALYETGKALLDIGTIPGSDMTPEAALTKLAYVIGKEVSVSEKRKLMQTNLRGEMKQMSATGLHVEMTDITLIDKFAEAMSLTSTEEVMMLREAIIPSLLCAAAKAGDVYTIEKLLDSGGSLLTSDYDGRTALHVAASEGHFPMVQFLLQKGALVHARDRYQNSPILDAIKFSHDDVVRVLTQAGAHLNMAPWRLGQELCSAANEDNVKMMECYKIVGVNFCQGDYDGRTALHVAVSRGHRKMVHFLLENKANVHIEDNFHTTPLTEAKRTGNDALLKILQESSSNCENGDSNFSPT